jgi:hypothetical protein
MKKTILITVFQSFIARTILGTDALRDLVADPDLHIVLLAPDYKAEYYRGLFSGLPNVTVEPVPLTVHGATLSTRMQRLAIWFLPTYFVRYNLEYLREGGAWGKYLLASVLNRIFAPIRSVRALFRHLDHAVSDTVWFDGIIGKYRPALVFSPDIFHHTDAHFLWAAKKANVATLGMVRSWDCPTNKNLLRVICDRTLANNEQVKEELTRFHDVPAASIEVVGFAQYDAYADPAPIGREEFCKKMGIDPAKRILLFAPGGKKITDIDWQYAQVLKEAVAAGNLPADLQVLVRNHPQGPADMSRFVGDPLFIDDRPGIVHGGNYRAAEMDASAVQHAIDSCANCDVAVTVNTSFGLDLAILDRPHIITAFDGFEQRPWLHAVARLHQEDNMKAFIATGAAKVARSAQELVQYISAYLEDPKLDAAGRERARRITLWRLDGGAGQRIAQAAKNLIA